MAGGGRSNGPTPLARPYGERRQRPPASLFSLTDAGIKAAKDSPRQLDAAKKLLTDMGGEMKQSYMVIGDFVGICEAPDDAVMARYFCSSGALASCARRP
jgi:hypothetical protein